jgi:hypothetical protein
MAEHTRDANPAPEFLDAAWQRAGQFKDWSIDALEAGAKRLLFVSIWSVIAFFIALGISFLIPASQMALPWFALLYLAVVTLLVLNRDSINFALLSLMVDAIYDQLSKDHGVIFPFTVDKSGGFQGKPDMNFERLRSLHTFKFAGKILFGIVLSELLAILFLSIANVWDNPQYIGHWILLSIVVGMFSTKWGRQSPIAWIAGFVFLAWATITFLFLSKSIQTAGTSALTFLSGVNPFLLLIISGIGYLAIRAIPEPVKAKDEPKGEKK